MKIVLDEQDIIDLVKEHFDGVTEATFNKTKVSLNVTVNSNSLKKKESAVKTQATRIVNTGETANPEKLNEEAKKKGAMAAGGRDRFIAHVG